VPPAEKFLSQPRNSKARDQLKVARIAGEQRIAELQRCCADQQVHKRNNNPLVSLLSVDFAS